MKLIDDDGTIYDVVEGGQITPQSGNCYGKDYDHIMSIDCTDDDCCHAELYLKKITQ